MNKELRDQLLQLPSDEKLKLTAELWDGLDDADLPLTPERIKERDRGWRSTSAIPAAAFRWKNSWPNLSRYG